MTQKEKSINSIIKRNEELGVVSTQEDILEEMYLSEEEDKRRKMLMEDELFDWEV